MMSFVVLWWVGRENAWSNRFLMILPVSLGGVMNRDCNDQRTYSYFVLVSKYSLRFGISQLLLLTKLLNWKIRHKIIKYTIWIFRFPKTALLGAYFSNTVPTANSCGFELEVSRQVLKCTSESLIFFHASYVNFWWPMHSLPIYLHMKSSVEWNKAILVNH